MLETLGTYLQSTSSPEGPSAADFTADLQDEAKRRSRGRQLRWSAICGILFSFALIVAGLVISPDATDFHILPTWLFIGGVFGIYMSVAQLRLSRRYLAPNADELLQRDTRPPVVYLRPFDADDVDASATDLGDYFGGQGTFDEAMGASEEEQLAVAMNEIGPFVAIGKPYDILPKLGAARIRVSDKEWQAKVTEWVARAQLIVLRLGFTGGVRWEIAHIVEHCPPEKLVLLVPFTPATGYETFREQMRQHFKRELPEIDRQNWTPPLSVCGLMYFTAGWEPHFVALERPLLNRISRILDKIGSMGGIRILAIMGPRPLVTLLLFVLQPRNWVTAQYKRALLPVMQQLGLDWKHRPFAHLLKPMVIVPLLLVALGILGVQLVREGRAQALVAQGEAMAAGGDYDQAIGEFNSALQVSPKYEPAFVGRGVAYDLGGHYAAAIQDLSAAIRMNPKDKRALMARGYAYQRSENCSAAVVDFTAVIAIDPANALARTGRCYCRLKSGQWVDAASDCRAATSNGGSIF